MPILNLTVSQYIVVALLITLWAFIARWVMVWVNGRKTEEVKKLWKKRGIETNSFRTRGSQYTLYEKGAMEQMHDALVNRAIHIIYGACIFFVMVVTAESIYFFMTPTTIGVYFAGLAVWLAGTFLWTILAFQFTYYLTLLCEKRRLTNNKLDE
jgi:hypothetical protein